MVKRLLLLPLVLIAIVLGSMLLNAALPWKVQRRARAMSGLSIPLSAHVDTVAEETGLLFPWWNSRLSMDSTAFERLVREARKEGYRRIPDDTTKPVSEWYIEDVWQNGGGTRVHIRPGNRTIVLDWSSH